MARPDPTTVNPADTLLARYHTLPGVADELLDADGAMRPAWRAFVELFARLGPEDIAARFGRGDQYLRDAGVFFRQQTASDASERDWPLSHVPVVIHEQEWQALAPALIQRADLLETVLADLYGENRLVADGLLPASLIAASPEWLRPLVAVAPPSGHFLHFIAFEIGRGPDGGWRILSDRTQAPAGAGFALENRVATSRVYAELFAGGNMHRLAGFFRAFRDRLQQLNKVANARAAILTPGPKTEHYFEHAYIARYLGMLLVEGEDLAVENGQVMVRTVSGLRPVGVSCGGLPANLADPLELDDSSLFGTPGLVSAMREGRLNLVNALGSGVLEMRALLAYMPRICEALRDEPLLLPNTATWWCGEPDWRQKIRQDEAGLLFSRAQTIALPFDPDDRTAHGNVVAFAASLGLQERDLVGQEIATLSSTPAYVDGRLQARPMSLRVFLARTADGWLVMPGGYARVGRTDDATAVSLQHGGSVADVWIVSDGPVVPDTMTGPRRGGYARPLVGALPARAADNLFWLGRYTERAETQVRLLRAHHLRLAESGDREAALPAYVTAYLDANGLDTDEAVPQALIDTLAASIVSAGRVRDRFSVDGWAALHDLHNAAREMADNVSHGDAAARAMGRLLRGIAGFSGLVHENMYRSAGWRFLTIGRSLEHAAAIASTVAHFTDPAAPDGALDLAVELGDSVMIYRRRYSVTTQRGPVVDLLVFDTLNPRSILYQMGELRTHVAALPGAEDHGLMSPLSRALLKAHSSLALLTPETLDAAALEALEADLGGLSDLLLRAYLT
jgi:uncharacterized circularly permuted ATP-grasp superfamily protein/uncharacterized alpha-E superfamily protein